MSTAEQKRTLRAEDRARKDRVREEAESETWICILCPRCQGDRRVLRKLPNRRNGARNAIDPCGLCAAQGRIAPCPRPRPKLPSGMGERWTAQLGGPRKPLDFSEADWSAIDDMLDAGDWDGVHETLSVLTATADPDARYRPPSSRAAGSYL